MSIFVFSLLAGLLFYQIVSAIQPQAPGINQQYWIGTGIRITLAPRTYVACKTAVLVLFILLFLGIVILLNVQGLHPVTGYAYRFTDALTSPHMAAGLFGGLVGFLLGNLLNRLLRSDPNYQFTSADRLQVALIFALIILGIGGEEVLRSAAQRINKVSVGTTTEISFADTTPKSSRISAEQPNSTFRNTQGQSGGSAGLTKLYDIGSSDKPNIDRDWQFIQVLSRYEHQKVPDRIDVGDLAQHTLSPIASCLLSISRLYGDNEFIERQLSLLSDALRDLAQPGQTNYAEIRSKLSDTAREVALYVGPRASELKALYERVGKDDRYACAPIIDPSFDSSLPTLTNASIDSFRTTREKLPYVAIAYASVMAALHRYEAAAITMDTWIRTYPPEDVFKSWYLLRARLAQGQFVDEWIRARGAAAPSSLRKYHIDNLKAIIDGMEAFAAINDMTKQNRGYTWRVTLLGASHSGDNDICKTANADDDEPLRTIYDSYLSAKKDYVDHALKHPIMKVNSAELIESEVEKLMPLSLSCLASNSQTRRASTRAEHIERYVRSRLNLLENTVTLKSSDKIQDEVSDDRRLLTLAFQLIESDVKRAQKNEDEAPIADRIVTAQILEIYETLLATQSQLQSFSEREVAN